MAAQVFYIQRFKSTILHGCQHGADMRQLAMRKYIVFDEFARAIACGAVVGVGGGDAMIHGQAVIIEQAGNF